MPWKSEHRQLLIILPLIVILMLAVWSVKPRQDEALRVTPVDGVWDLSGVNLSQSIALLTDAVEFVPNTLLAPDEFASLEALLEDTPWEYQYGTSRMRVRVAPGSYLICGYSVDYASRLYANGELLMEVGTPGESREATEPGVQYYVLPVSPGEDGEIVLVQQASNFIHREGGNHSRIYIGAPALIDNYVTRQFWPEVILMGIYLVLFVVHLLLYLTMRSYKQNLLFSLFCLIWFVRTGATGLHLLSAALPGLPWEVQFRLEYLAIPISGVLLVRLPQASFPGVLQKWFPPAASAVCGVFIAIDLFAPTLLMSYTTVPRVAVLGVIAVYFFARLLFLRRKPSAEQLAVLLGFGFLLVAALWDTLYYRDIWPLPTLRFAVSEMAMAVFVLFAMATMFLNTMREVAAAREAERKLAMENAVLDRVNRLKTDVMDTVSHETRTPLAVVSSYTELIVMELRAQGVSEQHAKDLELVSREIQHIAQLMSEMQSVSRARDADAGKGEASLSDIIGQTTRLYRHILEREKIHFEVDVPPDLPPVYANPGEVTQVLLNLLQNAGKHTKNGQVTVVARVEDADFVSVTVSDTGEGISPELMPNLFELGVSSEENGSGVGLPVCKTIITAHGGTIEIDSKPGEGTAVRFTLPFYERGGRDHA